MRFSCSLCCALLYVAAGLRAAEPNVEAAKPAEVEPLELRILAAHHRHEVLIQAARDQQADEEFARRAWSTTVADPKTGRPTAKWVRVIAELQDEFTGSPHYVVRLSKVDGKPVVDVLVVLDEWNITRTDIERAAPAIDRRGEYAVNLQLTDAGAKRLKELTTYFRPHAGNSFALGIIVDGHLVRAPTLRDSISKHAQITGKFNREQVESLVKRINENKAQ